MACTNVAAAEANEAAAEASPPQPETMEPVPSNVPGEGGEVPTKEDPGGIGPKRMSFNNATLLSKALKPVNMVRFFVSVVLGEILGSQFPVVIAMAIPTILHDFIVGRVFKIQNDVNDMYTDDWHRLNHNATFNVHIPWLPWSPDQPDAIAAYIPTVWIYWMSCCVLYSWQIWIIPRMCLPREIYNEAVTSRFLGCWIFFQFVNLGISIKGGMTASAEDGAHTFALLGSLSPTVFYVLGGMCFVWYEGRQISRVAGKNYMKCVIWICQAQTAIFAIEVIFLVGGFADYTVQRKETIIFLYRLVIWPVIWCCILMPIQRFTLFVWEGEHIAKIPFLAFFWLCNSVSSRTLMFQMSNPMYFNILVIADTVLQVLLNIYDGNLPVFDKLMHRCWLKRCMIGDQQDMDQIDRDRARMVRCIWFQAQSLLELIATFSQAFREWAFFDQRYVFGMMYKPSCDALNNGFNFNSLAMKVLVSVGGLIIGDIATSYVAYLKGLPLKEGFHLLIRNKRSWIGFTLLNMFTYMLTVLIMSVNVGRIGACTDFSNGCTCAGVTVYREICGCCSVNVTDLALSPYPMCQAALAELTA